MKKRIIIKDRNKLAKGVYANEEIEKEIREHKNPKTNRDYRKGWECKQ